MAFRLQWRKVWGKGSGYLQGSKLERLFWQLYEGGSMLIVQFDEVVYLRSDNRLKKCWRDEIIRKKKYESSFAGEMDRIW